MDDRDNKKFFDDFSGMPYCDRVKILPGLLDLLLMKIPKETDVEIILKYAEIIMQKNSSKIPQVTKFLLEHAQAEQDCLTLLNFTDLIRRYNPDRMEAVTRLLLKTVQAEKDLTNTFLYIDFIMQYDPSEKSDILRILVTQERTDQIVSTIKKLLDTYEDDALIPEDILKAAAHICPQLNARLFGMQVSQFSKFPL